MGIWISHTLSASIALLCLYIVYKWALSQDNQPQFNRFVILGCYVVSALFPILAASLLFKAPANAGSFDIEIDGISMTVVDSPADDSSPILPSLLIIAYLIGVIIISAKTITGIIRLRGIIRSGEQIRKNGYTIVITDNTSISPFSWQKYIVMNRNDFESSADMIIIHENEHISQLHRVDLLIARLFEIVMWFNPAAWLMTSELRAAHEFQADHAVVSKFHDPKKYQLLLIKKAAGKSFPVLANSLNHSNLKKRITMMLKPESRKCRRVRALALAPAVAVAMLCVDSPMVASVLDYVSDASVNLVSDSKVNDFSAENNISADNSLSSVAENTPAIYVDGKLYSGPLNEIPNSSIASMEVRKNGDLKEIHITTKTENNENSADGLAETKSDTRYLVDGNEVSSEELSAVAPDNVKAITVNKSNNEVQIQTKLPETLDGKLDGKLDRVHKQAQQMPAFPGGDKALMEFMYNNLRYPENETTPGKRRVVVQFVVDTDGKAKSPKIIRSQGEAFDNEAIRVVGLMPNFTPGMIDGKPVAVEYALPINFVIKDNDKKSGDKPDKVHRQAQQMPAFPGGDKALMEFMYNNLRYPENETTPGKRRVIVQFVVDTDGKAKNPKIIRSQGEAFDNEAIRVIGLMPNFTPGMTNGKPVAVEYTLPINFVIKNDDKK